MFQDVMKYLETKREIILGQDWKDKYKSIDDQRSLLQTLQKIQWFEPEFFSLNQDISRFMVKNIQDIARQQCDEKMKESCESLLNHIEQLKQKRERKLTFDDDYYQWITFIRTKQSLCVSTSELLKQFVQDPIMMKTFVSKGRTLVGSKDFLYTFNFTLSLFPELYQQEPILVEDGKEIVSNGLEENKDKEFQRLAKKTLKNTRKLEKSNQINSKKLVK